MQRLYDSQPEFYHSRYKDIQLAKYNHLFELVDAKNSLTLDAGIGTGTILKASKSFSRLVGIDLSLRSLEFLQNKNVRDSLFLINADIENLPFKDHCFFQVFSITVGQNLPSLHFLDEIKRILACSGQTVLSILRKKIPDGIETKLRKLFSCWQIDAVNDEQFEDNFFIIQSKLN